MERMPGIKWEKRVDYAAGMEHYFTSIKGVDKKGREFFYRGVIRKLPIWDELFGKMTYLYSAEYELWTDGNNFKLKGDKGKKDFDKANDAKKWVETAFRTKWAKDHV